MPQIEGHKLETTCHRIGPYTAFEMPTYNQSRVKERNWVGGRHNAGGGGRVWRSRHTTEDRPTASLLEHAVKERCCAAVQVRRVKEIPVPDGSPELSAVPPVLGSVD